MIGRGVGPRRLDADFICAVRTGLLIGLWAGGICIALYVTVLGAQGYGMDSHAYWLAGQTSHPYGVKPGGEDAFLYSPLFLQLIKPLTLFEWSAFAWLWAGLLVAVLFWLVRPIHLRWRIPIMLLCVPEIQVGNIHILMAAALVVGFVRPMAWAFLLLTKVVPGLPVAVWLAARREWRTLLQAAAWTAALVAVSIVISPTLWSDWMRFMTSNGGNLDTNVWLRFGVSLLIAAAGGRKGWAWLLPLAVLLAVPTGAGVSALSILAAVPRLLPQSVLACEGSVHWRKESMLFAFRRSGPAVL